MQIAIETSTLHAGVAVMDGEDAAARKILSPDKPASEYLLATLSVLMEEVKITFDDISSYSVSVGPGSFTGLRVGLMAVKTLAYFHKRPVIPVPTLDVMAFQAGRQTLPVAVVMDARKGEIYGAKFRKTDPVESLTEPFVGSMENFFSTGEDVVLIGDALFQYREKIMDKLGSRASCVPRQFWRPDPVMLGRLALQNRYPALEGQALFKLVPMYIRKPEAEIQWEKRYGST